MPAASATNPRHWIHQDSVNVRKSKGFPEGAALFTAFEAATPSLSQRTYARNEGGKVYAQAVAGESSKAKKIDEPVLVVGATGGVGEL